MMSLNDMSIAKRFVITMIIIIVVILALFIIDLFTREVESQTLLLPKTPYDSRLIELDKQALDEAYRDRIMHLFVVWMRDEQGQPGRALIGVQQARRAYILATMAIEKRERELPESGKER
jgi:hypothetical protein